MNQFKAVIFDMDGLLVDSERLALQFFQQNCIDFNLPDLTSVFNQCIGLNQAETNKLMHKAFGHLVDINLFIDQWRKVYKAYVDVNATPLKQGVKPFVKSLKQMNMPMAVATSTPTHRALIKLGFHDLPEYFDAIVGGEQVEKSKPEPDIYLKAANELQIDPKQCLALEDSNLGVKAAIAAGMTVVQIPDLLTPEKGLGQIILPSLDHVMPHFSN